MASPTIERRISDLEARTNTDEGRWGPPICTWYEEGDGSDLRRGSPSCPVGHDHPTAEDCNNCRAKKIIMVMIATDEDIRMSNERKGIPRNFVP